MAEGQAGPGPEGQTPVPPTEQSNRNLEFLEGIYDGQKWREVPTTRADLLDESLKLSRTRTRLEGHEDFFNEDDWKEKAAKLEQESDESLKDQLEGERQYVEGMLSGKIRPINIGSVKSTGGITSP